MTEASIFAYGTLMIDSVMEVLLGRVPISEPGILKGYRSARLRDHAFPAIVPAARSEISGRIYHHLLAEEISLLDAFEWSDYRRIVEVVVASNGQAHRCFVYLLPANREDKLSASEWNLQDFAEQELGAYLQSCREWKRNYAKREGQTETRLVNYPPSAPQ